VRRPLALGVTAAATAALLAGCGSSSSSSSTAASKPSSTASASTPATTTTAAAAKPGVAIETAHNKLGTILVAGPEKKTVYLFEADKGSKSTCSGDCADDWPPVTTDGAPTASGGALSGDLGTTTRSDGTKQVTYKGQPLYFFEDDKAAGQTNGEGSKAFGAGWYVMKPSGKKIDDDDDDSGSGDDDS
jgi:predicted lipoprotein with Yx(FWY)xxD motif